MKQLKSKEGDYGPTGGWSPGKLIALVAFVFGCGVAAFYVQRIVAVGEEPFPFHWMLFGVLMFWLSSVGFWWGLARESFTTVVQAISDRVKNG